MEQPTFDLKKQIVSDALTKALDKANVPQRQHLAIVQALQKRIDAHEQDIKAWKQMLFTHEQITSRHEEQLNKWDAVINSILSAEKIRGRDGAPGQHGRHGKDGINGKDGKPGKNGKDADEEMILNRLLAVLPSMIPEPVPGENVKIDEDALFEKLIARIKKNKELDLSHIKGSQRFIKDKVSYKIEELMHGGGSSTGTYVANEIVSGSGTTWTLTNTPKAGTLSVYAIGQLLLPTTDYTLSGKTITTVNSWTTGTIAAIYFH